MSATLTRRAVLATAATAAVAATLPASEAAYDLPSVGDTSLAAIGARLRYSREHYRYEPHRTIERAAEIAGATPAEWQSWESGQAKPPARNLWLSAVGMRGPTEWIL